MRALPTNRWNSAVQPQFWDERWRRGQIGFHLATVHPALKRFWGRLELPLGARVLVPLCGKSLDLLWLRDAGFDVIGVEWSALAVEVFCLENGVPARRRLRGGFELFEAPRLALWRGDFFALTPALLGPVAAVYDRAALVAFGPETRPAYALQTASLLHPGARMLLVTTEYPQAEKAGPPFSVDPKEVRRLYSSRFDLDEIARQDVLADEPRMRERGLTRLDEVCYRLTQQPPHD